MCKQSLKLHSLLPLFSFTLLILLVIPDSAFSQEDSEYAVLPEKLLRQNIIHSGLPEFPTTDKRKRITGVVVAAIRIDVEGNPTKIQILQAPSSSISEAVMHSLLGWRFRPFFLRGTPTSVKGKLTFYFKLEGGRFKVENPRQFS